MAKLERYEITPEEAIELRDLVARDVEQSSEDETTKALILIGLGMLLGHALSKGEGKIVS